MIIRRGDVLLVDFDPVRGAEKGKVRPCIVVQNDVGNAHSPTTIVAPVTSRIPPKDYPTDVFLTADELGLSKEGTVNCSQLRAISVEHRVIKKLGALTADAMRKVDAALKASLGLD